MEIFEIATGFTPLPAKIGAATEIVVENLIKNFDAENDVVLIDVHNEDRTGIDCVVKEIKMPRRLMKPTGFMSVKHKLKRILYSIKLAFVIKKLQKQKSNAVFHFHNQYNFAFSYAWTFLFRKKRQTNTWVYTVHSNLWFDEKKNKPRKKHYLEIYSIQRADIIICLNPTLAKNIENYFDYSLKGKMEIIPHGVNDTVYCPNPAKKRNKPLRFINVGSVYHGKNQLESLKILTPFLKSGECDFYFIGANVEPAYLDEINAYTESHGIEQNVRYLGEISPGEELNKIYNTADVYLSNSKSEAFGLVALEALATGLPALLSPIFEISLGALPKSEAVHFCNDENEFRTMIEVLLNDNDELQRLSTVGRQYTETYFSWKQIALQHEKIFNCTPKSDN